MTSRLCFRVLGGVCSLLLACADFERGAPLPDAGVPSGDGGDVGQGDGGEAPSFSGVHSLLTSGCQSCHRGGGAAGNTGYVMTGDVDADYAASLDLVDVSSPAASRLLRKASGAGHGGGAVYGDGTPEYQALLAWVAGGAQP
ncbi:hypothetical protein ACLEPN_40930 [Myxococcus sp. 1LA]